MQFQELPTWVLLYADSDVRVANSALPEGLHPFMNKSAPAQFTVSYFIITTDLQITVDALMDHDDIASALDHPGFGKMPITNRRLANGMFGNAISLQKPA